MRNRLVLGVVFAVMAVAVVPAGSAAAQGQRFPDVLADHYAFEAPFGRVSPTSHAVTSGNLTRRRPLPDLSSLSRC